MLKHGKHVASAVPACFGSLEEAEQLLESVKSAGGGGKGGLKYMMFETSCFHEDLFAMRQIYHAGGFGKIVYAEGEYFHYMPQPIDSFKGWRIGLPPQWYPTHSNAYYVGAGGGHFTDVSCIGIRSTVSHLQPENNQYKNGFGTEIERASSRFLDHCPVDAGEALDRDLGLQLLPQLQIRFRPELQRRALLGPQPHAVGDVVLGNDQVLAEVVLAADDDMAVRVAGVEMVDRYPVEFGAEIGLHLAHDVSGEAAQIGQAVAVLGRDDEPERVAVCGAALDEGTAVGVTGVAAIQFARPAIAGGAVPLEIAQVRAGCS